MTDAKVARGPQLHAAAAEEARPRGAAHAAASPGVERYVAAAGEAARRHAADLATIRKCRFDTIAVHGLYTMEEALDFNQGSVIEPIYMSTSQGYRDADEMEVDLRNSELDLARHDEAAARERLRRLGEADLARVRPDLVDDWQRIRRQLDPTDAATS